MRRSRWAVAAVCGLVTALFLSGCGNPGGVDGDLTDDWIRLGEPKIFVPPAGTCHEAGYSSFASLTAFDPVDCAQPHRAETIHVGTFSGAAAGGTVPPAKGSSALRVAYAECDKRASSHLGADFRYGRLWLGVVVPSSAGWSGGARWFRCDLFEVSTVEDYDDSVTRQGSLKNALTEQSALRLGCYAVKADSSGSIDTMPAVACTKSHNSEFVGVYQASASAAYPKSEADWQRLHTGCRTVVAGYVKVPDDANLKFRTGTVVVPNLAEDWQDGNHGVRCYLYLKDAKFTKSLKGAGSAALPAR